MCLRAAQKCFAFFDAERRRRCKRYLSYVVICCNFLLGGFEYGIIFPTAMDYIVAVGGGSRETFYFGLLIVSYGLANIVGGYVGGLWADTMVETRPLLVMAAVPQIVGNALYFFAVSPGQLVASRALSGVGSGANTAMLAELSRTTSLRHRTSVISVITFARQLGIVFGPAVGAYLTDMPDVFKHSVTTLNAPGLLLTLCYLAYLLLLTVAYSNLTVDEDERESSCAEPALSADESAGCQPWAEPERAERPQAVPAERTARTPLLLSLPQPSQPTLSSWPPYQSLTGWRTPGSSPATPDWPDVGSPSGRGRSPHEVRMMPSSWVYSLSSPLVCARCAAPLTVGTAGTAGPRRVSVSGSVSVVNEWREVLCWPMAALLACNLVAYLSQTSLEAAMPTLVERDLLLGINATGNIFIVGGVVQCIVLGCIFATPVLPCLHDQRLITAGLLIMAAAHLMLAAVLAQLRAQADGRPPHRRWFWLLLAASAVQFFGYPLVNSVVTSFLSKLLSRGAQGVGAAGLRLSMCAGLMLGPLWGASMLHHQLPLFLVPLATLLLSLLAFSTTELRGHFRARMQEAAVVDTVTPRVRAAPRRVRTISALNHIRQVCADTARDGDSVANNGAHC